jgi:hypothetical protein
MHNNSIVELFSLQIELEGIRWNAACEKARAAIRRGGPQEDMVEAKKELGRARRNVDQFVAEVNAKLALLTAIVQSAGKGDEDRDQYCYWACVAGTPHKQVVAFVKAMPGWDALSESGVRDRAAAYGKRHGLPDLAPRKRPRKPG